MNQESQQSRACGVLYFVITFCARTFGRRSNPFLISTPHLTPFPISFCQDLHTDPISTDPISSEYDILDAILELYVEQHLGAEEITARGFDETMVRWIQRRVDLNEWKRQQAAPGLRVTSKAFGMGRRMPIVQRFV